MGGGSSKNWNPVEALRRDDADVSIVFMRANSIYYDNMVHDPFFAAEECKTLTSDGVDLYYCNPNYRTYCYAKSK